VVGWLCTYIMCHRGTVCLSGSPLRSGSHPSRPWLKARITYLASPHHLDTPAFRAAAGNVTGDAGGGSRRALDGVEGSSPSGPQVDGGREEVRAVLRMTWHRMTAPSAGRRFGSSLPGDTARTASRPPSSRRPVSRCPGEVNRVALASGPVRGHESDRSDRIGQGTPMWQRKIGRWHCSCTASW
jgi:hypothetical protein